MGVSKQIVVDRDGYRLNVGIILTNKNAQLFWGRRVGQDAWQFPQGGLHAYETPEEALYRELQEEIGLIKDDVELIGQTRGWIKYDLPEQFIRHRSRPLVIGQKQKWFLLRLCTSHQKLRLDTSQTPEFDSWCWVPYWYPVNHVIYFKQKVYLKALEELAPLLSADLLSDPNKPILTDEIDECPQNKKSQNESTGGS